MRMTQGNIQKLTEDQTQFGPFKLSRDSTGRLVLLYQNSEITFNSLNHERLKTILAEEVGSNPLALTPEFSFASDWVDYAYNHFKGGWFFSNGKVKQSTLHEIRIRVESDGYGAYTNQLLKILLDKNVVLPPEVESRIKTVKDYLTGNNIKFVKATRIQCNLALLIFPVGVDPKALGYIRVGNNRGWATPDVELVEYNGEKYFPRDLSICSECGAHSPSLHSSGVCDNCLGVEPSLVQIRGYSDRAPNFIPMKVGKWNKTLFKSPMLFGIELEYETTNKEEALLDTARLLGNHAIFKRDGSIRDGFEIVTTAATLDHHEAEFSKFFGKFPKTLKAASNTGMHIHVSREPLNMLTQGKLVEFMNREDNREFIKAIAGREANSYTRIDSSRTISFPHLNRTAERYNTLNINNEHTLEFRIFATPTDYKTFIARLDFCNALVHYCSPCQSQASVLKNVTHHEEFMKYVRANKKSFPHYYDFLFGSEEEARQQKAEQFKLAAFKAVKTNTKKGVA